MPLPAVASMQQSGTVAGFLRSIRGEIQGSPTFADKPLTFICSRRHGMLELRYVASGVCAGFLAAVP